MLLGHAEDLLQAGRWNRLLLARLDEARGYTAEAQAGYEQHGTPADISRILRKDAQWEQAAELDGEDEDLKWLLKSRARGPADSTGGCTSKNAGASTRRSSGCGREELCAAATEQPSKAAPMAAANCRDNMGAIRFPKQAQVEVGRPPARSGSDVARPGPALTEGAASWSLSDHHRACRRGTELRGAYRH